MWKIIKLLGSHKSTLVNETSLCFFHRKVQWVPFGVKVRSFVSTAPSMRTFYLENRNCNGFEKVLTWRERWICLTMSKNIGDSIWYIFCCETFLWPDHFEHKLIVIYPQSLFHNAINSKMIILSLLLLKVGWKYFSYEAKIKFFLKTESNMAHSNCTL